MDRLNESAGSPAAVVPGTGQDLDARQVQLVRVAGGVAAGRVLAAKGNARVECWTLLTSLDQFDACLGNGPLRFCDPLLLQKLRREFEHVLNRSSLHEPAIREHA